MEPVTTDRVQQIIDDETAERFPAGAAPRLRLLHYGDQPEIEPGERYLLVILNQDHADQDGADQDGADQDGADQDHAARDAWIEEHFDRLEEFRMRRLPEVRGFMFTTEAREAAGRGRTAIMRPDGVSLLDPEEDALARGLTVLGFGLGPADVATLDALITAGLATGRSAAVGWALTRVREQPAYTALRGRAPAPGGLASPDGLDRTGPDQLQTRLDEQVRERYPDSGVTRVALLRYGDDPHAEPGDLIIRVFIEESAEDVPSPAWERDHRAMLDELHDELAKLAEQVPGARYLEVYVERESGHHGRMRQRHGGSPHDPPERERIPVGVGLGPAELEMLQTLISTGIATSRVAGIRWALARIRERPAYARLGDRACELADLKARF